MIALGSRDADLTDPASLEAIRVILAEESLLPEEATVA